MATSAVQGDHPGASLPSSVQHRGQRHRKVAACLRHVGNAVVIGTIWLAAQAREAIAESEVTRYVSAIYRADGGDKARVPYGIMSVKVRDKDHARRLCEQTVRNNFRRWVEAGKPGSFVKFLALRYCPPSDDPKGHVNWVRNVSFFLHSAR